MSETVEKSASLIIDAKQRYSAGVLKYRQMGYWDADYFPKDTDTLCLFRIFLLLIRNLLQPGRCGRPSGRSSVSS